MKRHQRIIAASALAVGLSMMACADETKPGNATGGAGTSVPGSGAAGTGASAGAGANGTARTGAAGTTGQTGTGQAGTAASTTGAGGGSTLPVVTTATPCTVASADALIDDFESGANGVMHACVRGYWYTYNDKSVGTQTPGAALWKPEKITDRPGSMFAAHSTAMGFSGDTMGHAYAAFGLDLDSASATSKALVDASAFKGVTFWAKGTGAVRVELHTKTSDPDYGCAAMCYDFPYKKLTLTAAWQKVTIPWADFAQDKFGTVEMVTGRDIGSLQFASKAEMMAIAPYDMWLDDLQFMP